MLPATETTRHLVARLVNELESILGREHPWPEVVSRIFLERLGKSTEELPAEGRTRHVANKIINTTGLLTNLLGSTKKQEMP